jgi:hypothetical protein
MVKKTRRDSWEKVWKMLGRPSENRVAVKTCMARQIVYHWGTRERRLIHKMKTSDCSGKREVAEA